MTRFRVVVMILVLALVALAFPSRMKGDEWNKKTIVTFSQPVEIPGVGAQVLPAGTYVFKLLDSSSDRHIVQIFNEREDHVYATILAIPNYRLQTTDKTVMTFGERAAGQPEAIRAWFYPGANWGQEFVYPKTRAIELAKLTNQPVLAMPAELANVITTPVKSVDEPPVIALKKAPVEAVKPTGEVVAMTEVVEPPPAQDRTCEYGERVGFREELAPHGQLNAAVGTDWAVVAGCRRCSFLNSEANCLSKRSGGWRGPPRREPIENAQDKPISRPERAPGLAHNKGQVRVTTCPWGRPGFPSIRRPLVGLRAQIPRRDWTDERSLPC